MREIIHASESLARSFETIILAEQPKVIIETGTNDGTGSTFDIASALKKHNIQSKFYSIECNPEFYQKANKNLRRENLLQYVELINGLSLPDNLIPSYQELFQRLKNPPVPIVDFLNNPANGYYKETNFRVEDDILGKLLEKNKVDLFFLDSAGHIGYEEFNYVLSKINYNTIFILDDTRHIKHHLSRKFMIDNPGKFEVLEDSTEKFGHIIAKYNY